MADIIPICEGESTSGRKFVFQPDNLGQMKQVFGTMLFYTTERDRFKKSRTWACGIFQDVYGHRVPDEFAGMPVPSIHEISFAVLQWVKEKAKEYRERRKAEREAEEAAQ